MAAGFESCKVNASNVVSLKLDESVLEAYSGEVRTVCMAMRSDWICVMVSSFNSSMERSEPVSHLTRCW